MGRVANRIAGGKFSLDEKDYTLALNNGPNSLHGGNVGFDKLPWTGTEIPNGVELSLLSPDGDEGFPGAVRVTAAYTLTGGEEPTLTLTMSAEALDQATPVNLAQHSYFNLAGHDQGSVKDHEVLIPAARFTPVDEDLIPTGAMEEVGGTVMDLTSSSVLGPKLREMDPNFEASSDPIGFDHNYCLDKGPSAAPELAAEVKEPTSGRTLRVSTTAPGVQFYTANFLDGVPGKDGASYQKHGGFCLETQHFPSSVGEPNAAKFGDGATPIIRPGEAPYRHIVAYTFGTLP